MLIIYPSVNMWPLRWKWVLRPSGHISAGVDSKLTTCFIQCCQSNRGKCVGADGGNIHRDDVYGPDGFQDRGVFSRILFSRLLFLGELSR